MSSILPPSGFDIFHDATLSCPEPAACSEASRSSRSLPALFRAEALGACSTASPAVSEMALSCGFDLDLRRCFFCDRGESSLGSRFRFREAVSPFVSIFEIMLGGNRKKETSNGDVASWTLKCLRQTPNLQRRLQLQASRNFGGRQKKLKWGQLSYQRYAQTKRDPRDKKIWTGACCVAHWCFTPSPSQIINKHHRSQIQRNTTIANYRSHPTRISTQQPSSR